MDVILVSPDPGVAKRRGASVKAILVGSMRITEAESGIRVTPTGSNTLTGISDGDGVTIMSSDTLRVVALEHVAAAARALVSDDTAKLKAFATEVRRRPGKWSKTDSIAVRQFLRQLLENE